jgi:hypothetical protein
VFRYALLATVPGSPRVLSMSSRNISTLHVRFSENNNKARGWSVLQRLMSSNAGLCSCGCLTAGAGGNGQWPTTKSVINPYSLFRRGQRISECLGLGLLERWCRSVVIEINVTTCRNGASYSILFLTVPFSSNFALRRLAAADLENESWKTPQATKDAGGYRLRSFLTILFEDRLIRNYIVHTKSSVTSQQAGPRLFPSLACIIYPGIP